MLTSAASKVDLGKSKFGGNPDLPHGALFPQNNTGEDIPFGCQINLKDFDTVFVISQHSSSRRIL
ncbi:DUF1963 domain-containing protein [Leptospira yasudae]|uniref:DUF1963 domain-containing protein n=1 Tax=Leptospira yasudae TaxID=2202201 RepID=UPI001083EA4B|nr:DUF1963 domain-containing protein [Leptospira yasudae]TGM04582.1 DUF1963 domain-containing protein [Leptospira yasudae]